jgi:hypothetical protein
VGGWVATLRTYRVGCPSIKAGRHVRARCNEGEYSLRNNRFVTTTTLRLTVIQICSLNHSFGSCGESTLPLQESVLTLLVTRMLSSMIHQHDDATSANIHRENSAESAQPQVGSVPIFLRVRSVFLTMLFLGSVLSLLSRSLLVMTTCCH